MTIRHIHNREFLKINDFVSGIKIKEILNERGSDGRKLLFECPSCKKDWKTSLKSVKSGKSKMCKECFGKAKSGKMLLEAENLQGKTFGCLTYVSEAYRKDGTRFIHVKCIQEGCTELLKCVNSSNWKAGKSSSCPCLQDSLGMLKIKSYLKFINVDYLTEVTKPGCEHKKPLRFDIEVKVNGHIGLIEYNGIQHYKPIAYWGGEQAFNDNLTRDKIKLNFAKEHGIPLLTISYFDDVNIPTIIDSFINEISGNGSITRKS